MIAKELDASCHTDVMSRAGRAAEEQMAHYLNRAFGSAKDIYVFNGLRFVANADVAQIDHLVLHRWGMVIVESKSVTGQVEINALGEWVRMSGRGYSGMASPLEQALRQADFLKTLIKPQAPRVLRRVVGLQIQFTHVPIDVLVAISDSGIIKRSPEYPMPEVCKADQICGKIRKLIGRYKRANSLLGSGLNPFDVKDSWHTMNDSEMERLREFLLESHSTPKPPSIANMPMPSVTNPTTKAPAGKEEQGQRLSTHCCAECGKPLTEKVVSYCLGHSDRYAGRLLCFQHQRRSSKR